MPSPPSRSLSLGGLRPLRGLLLAVVVLGATVGALPAPAAGEPDGPPPAAPAPAASAPVPPPAPGGGPPARYAAGAAVKAAAAPAAALRPAPIPASASWLTTVNYYRAMAGLAPVTNNPAWTAGAVAHSRWTALNGVLGHYETPGTPGYSPAGAAAAARSNVAMWTGRTATNRPSEREAVELFMVAPFHAAGILDPRLRTSAFGLAHGSGRSGATLDVVGGLTGSPRTSPTLWPGPGTTTPLLAYRGGERPDPLGPCAGYRAPTGLPIVVQFPERPSGATSRVSVDGQPVAHCAYTETTPSAAGLREYLAARHLMIIIPRQPLEAGRQYRVQVTTANGVPGGRRLDWGFRAAGPPSPVTAASVEVDADSFTVRWNPSTSAAAIPITG